MVVPSDNSRRLFSVVVEIGCALIVRKPDFEPVLVVLDEPLNTHTSGSC